MSCAATSNAPAAATYCSKPSGQRRRSDVRGCESLPRLYTLASEVRRADSRPLLARKPNVGYAMPLVDWYRRNRARSARSSICWMTRPITSGRSRFGIRSCSTRAICPAFSFNTLVKRGLGRRASTPGSSRCSRAASIRDESAASTQASSNARWPTRETVQGVCRRGPTTRCWRRWRTAISISRTIPCSIAPRRRSASSSTRRCTRRRCSTCGIDFPTRRSGVPRLSASRRRIDAAACVGRGARRASPRSVSRRCSEPFAWDNERPARGQVPAFAIERHNVTNAAVPGVRRGRRLADERWWQPKDWEWMQRERESRTRCSGALRARPVVLARHVRPRAAARGVAGLREPGRGPRVRAVERRRLPTEAEFQRAAYGTRNGHGQRYPWGDAPPAARHGVFDFSSWDPQPAGAIRRAPAPGASTTSWATAGSGPPRSSARSPASRRCRPIPSTPPTSSTASTS